MKKSQTLSKLFFLLAGLNLSYPLSAAEIVQFVHMDATKQPVSFQDLLANLEKKFNVRFNFSEGMIGSFMVDSAGIDGLKKTQIKNFLEKISDGKVKIEQVDEMLYVILPKKTVKKEDKTPSVPISSPPRKNNNPGQQQQERTVTGRIIDQNTGLALEGVTIRIQGKNISSNSSPSGQFSLSKVGDNDVLVFSILGYNDLQVPVQGESEFSVELNPKNIGLDEVVVTALGVKREKKALGYSIQEVQGSSLNTAKEANLMSNMTGKVAGLSIQNPPGLFEDPKISLRGSSNVLVVVDNVPVETNFWNISSDDIAEVSVLKGPAAAALYGSRGKNGAILITTKRGGGKDGKVEISINSSVMFQPSFVYLPKTQSKYGTGQWGQFEWVDGAGGGVYDNDYVWGPKLDQRDPNTKSGFVELPQWDSPIDPATGKRIPTPFISRGKDNIRNFFNTGNIISNNIAIGASTEKTNYRFSFTQLDQKGIDPGARIDASTVAFSGGHKFTDKFSIETSINYNKQYSDNYPRTSYFADNNMYNIGVWMGADVDVRGLKDYWEPGQEGIKQRNYNYQYYNNPYYIANEFRQEYSKDVVYGFANFAYQFTPELKLSYRANLNWHTRYTAQKRPKGFVGYNPDYMDGGFYPDYNYDFELNNEVLLNYDKRLSSLWSISALAGANNRNNNWRNMSLSASALSIPGVYNIGNSKVPITGTNNTYKKLVNSFYGSATIGYHDALYLTLTGRNDWSSGMPVKKNSYFYPSVSFSGVVSELVEMPSFISFAKARAAWIRVGGDMSPYSSRPTYSYGTRWGGTPTLSLGGTLYPQDIEPDFKNTIEFGADIRLLKNRIGFDISYFEDTYTNQITQASISSSSGYTSRLINSDKKTRTKGWEVTMNSTPVKTENFSWDLALNWSRTRDWLIQAESGKNGRDGYVKEGEKYGYLYYRNEFETTPDGQFVYRNGLPVKSNGVTNLGFGPSNWVGGLTSSFKYKDWFLSFSVDGRWGGLLYSRLNQKLWEAGKHINSANEQYRDADNRDEKTYIAEGQKIVSGNLTFDEEGFIKEDTRVFEKNDVPVYYRSWANAYYNQSIYTTSMFDATYLKLREVILSYTIPTEWTKKLGLKGASVAFIGRNLFLWTKEESYMDPDVQGGSGETRLYVPTPRNLGFNVKLNF